MATFGQIVNGTVQNICMGTDVHEALGATYAADVIQSLGGASTWHSLPDGTVEGSTTADGINFTPPPVPARQMRSLTATEFNELCFAALGGGPTGMAAFQAVLDAAQAAGGAARACVTHYNKSDNFEYSDVQGFFAILEAATCITQDEIDAVSSAWPKA